MNRYFNRFLNRLFSTTTRPFELVNSFYFMSYAYVFWDSGEILYAHNIYAAFQKIPLWLTISCFAVLGLLQFVMIWRDTAASREFAGWLSLCAGVVWAFVYGAFYAAYPPLNTGMMHSAVMFFACLLIGKYMIDQENLIGRGDE